MSKPHNPYNLTPEQIGVSDGWRLLDEDEVPGLQVQDRFPLLFDIEMKWIPGFEWDGTGWWGYNKLYTYRTKLTREELAKARGLA